MPLQNRVTPLGEIIATPARGTVMGNRGGALHDAHKRLAGRRWVNRHWLVCVLSFRGRKRQVMAPSRYTELFFLDEAVALAAGHRPCFECRRADFLRFAALWGETRGRAGRGYVEQIDLLLHAERLDAGGAKRLHGAPYRGLPDGAFVLARGAPHLVFGDRLLEWSPGGYARARPRPGSGEAVLITPPSTLGVIAAGYAPALHPSAQSLRRG